MQKWQDLRLRNYKWIKSYAEKNKIKTLMVVGVSGGIDSRSGFYIMCKNGTGHYCFEYTNPSIKNQFNLSNKHITWLKSNWENVEGHLIDLTGTCDLFYEEVI